MLGAILLWSPLAAMGAAPFVALAGVRAVRAGALRVRALAGPP